MSFGSSVNDYTPSLFPEEHEYFIAPYWADVDISNAGRISYEVHTTRNGGTSSVLLSQVNGFISEREDNLFVGDWMLVVEWNQVPQVLGSISVVRSSYGINNREIVAFLDLKIYKSECKLSWISTSHLYSELHHLPLLHSTAT